MTMSTLWQLKKMGLILMHIVCPHILLITDCKCLEAKIKGQKSAICFYYQLLYEAASSLKKNLVKNRSWQEMCCKQYHPHTFIE